MTTPKVLYLPLFPLSDHTVPLFSTDPGNLKAEHRAQDELVKIQLYSQPSVLSAITMAPWKHPEQWPAFLF